MDDREPADGKTAWRARLLTARRELIDRLGPTGRAEQAEHLAQAAVEWLASRGSPGATSARRRPTLTAFESMRTEPPTGVLIDRLRAAQLRVLVPITRPDHLDWTDGREQFGPDELSQVDVAFIPALAIDRAGVRLGRGGGYYDRALPLLPEHAVVIAILHDHEILDALPAEPHDAPVHGSLTAAGGVQLVG